MCKLTVHHSPHTLCPSCQNCLCQHACCCFLKAFSVKDALDFLLSAWTRINPATINHTWQLLVSHLCSRQATIQPPLCNRQASIQPLADAEAVTLSAAQAMPNFQHLTITEIQETHTLLEWRWIPTLYCNSVVNAVSYWNSREERSSVMTMITLTGSPGGPIGCPPYT